MHNTRTSLCADAHIRMAFFSLFLLFCSPCVRVCMNVLLSQKLPVLASLRFIILLNLCRLCLFSNQINVSGTDINVASKARLQNTQYNSVQKGRKRKIRNKTYILNSIILHISIYFYIYKRKRENKEAALCFLFSCGILIYFAARKAAVMPGCLPFFLIGDFSTSNVTLSLV